MKKVPVWLIISLSLFLLCIIPWTIAYKQRNDIQVREETLQGDRAYMEGIEFENEYEPKLIIRETRLDKELEEIIKDMEDGKKIIKIADYLEYMTIDFEIDNNNRIYDFKGDNKFYKIKVPDYAEALIEKTSNRGGTSIMTELIGIPYIPRDLPSVVIGDRMYFTIPSLNLADWLNDDYMPDESVEDSICLGIMSFPMSEDNKTQLYYSDIKIDYLLEPTNNINQYILDMKYIQEEGLLVLLTLEDNKLYAYIYDPAQEVMVLKKEIGETLASCNLIDISVNVQNNYLLLDLFYEEELVSEETYNYFYVAAAYEILDGDVNKLVENEYMSKLDKEYQNINMDHERVLYYENDKIYIASKNYDAFGGNSNSIYLMAMDNDEVLYLGNISNSSGEDYSIASIDIDEGIFVPANDRIIDKYNYVVD